MSEECKFEVRWKDKIFLLPLVNKDKINNIICELDYVFKRSVVERPEYDGLISKIAERAIVMAAYLDNAAVGYCAFYMNDFANSTAYISLIAVKEAYQNMHVGTALIQYIKQIAVVNDIKQIRLEVDKDNENAIRFYMRRHFTKERQASEVSDYMVCLL